VVAAVTPMSLASEKELEALNLAGYRTIAVVAGRSDALELIGFIAVNCHWPRTRCRQLCPCVADGDAPPVLIAVDELPSQEHLSQISQTQLVA
jgi:hypothetical protein